MGLISKFFGITESESSKLTEGIGLVARGGGLFNQKIDDLPQDEHLQGLYNKAYANFGIVAKIIDATTEQVVQSFYFKGKNEDKLKKLKKELNLDKHLFEVCKTMLKNGNCFVEVVGSNGNIKKLKLLPPEQMVVIREVRGKVVAYVQTTYNKNIIWGKITDASIFSLKDNQVVGDINKIIHYTFNLQAGEKYGQSLIRPALRMLRVREQIENDLPIILQRYLSPIIHVQVGDEEHQISQAQLEEIRDNMKNIYADTEYVTDYFVKMNVLSFKDKSAMQISDIFDIIDKDIMMAMGMYPVLTGKSDTGDTKSAEVQLRAEGRHIKAIQRELKLEFEDKFIQAQGLGTEDDELMWEMTDERETIEHISNVIQLKNAQLLTPQKANDLLPKMFQEELPELNENSIGGGNVNSKPPSLHNPNNPHQSSQMVKGQRVNRDDHRNPLNKKVKDTGKSKHEVVK